MVKKLLSLFLTFAKIGGITFGGGLTMLPLLTREIVQKKKWATRRTFRLLCSWSMHTGYYCG